MRKSFVIILLFLTIIAVELGLLCYNWFRPQPEAFSLDEQQYAVAERNANVRPFLFEIEASERLQRFSEIINEEMAENPLSRLINAPKNLNAAKETDLTAVHDQESQEVAVEQGAQSDTKDVSEVLPDSAITQRAKIAIVIDDVGLSDPFVKELAKLHKRLTASFLTYGAASAKQAKLLQDSGLEVMLHVPMMPHVPADLAPVTLSPDMDKAETQAELEKMIRRYDGATLAGANNHMGSLLTEKIQHMRYVMEVLKRHDMFFLDSKTTSRSVSKVAAEEYGVPYIARDVFLDNKNEYDYIMGQLKQAEKIASKHGHVVAIGHPHSQTLRALKDWLLDVEERGFTLVYVSDLLKKDNH